MMGRLTCAAATLLCVLPVGRGHLGTAPGRFSAGLGGGYAPPPPIPINPGSNTSCATTFSLNGSKYDVSSLQVDVGGWVAENSVDKFSCARSLRTVALGVLPLAAARATVPNTDFNELSLVAADCINVCAVVTSDRNCICYPCGATEYPSSQVDKDPVKGETCESCAGSLTM